MHSLKLGLVVSALSLGAVACTGTSTGNPYEEPAGGPGFGESSGCKQQSTEELEPDAPTFLGATPDELFGPALGSHDETLHWHPQSIASYGPESGQHALTISVTATGKPRVTRYVSDPRGGELASDCGDQLEQPVEVVLKSDEGALDERFTGLLVARSPHVVSLRRVLKADELSGSFAVTEVHQPGYELAQLTFALDFTRFGSSGSLETLFENRNGDSVSAAPSQGPTASWGIARCSGQGHAVPLDAQVAGFSGNDVLALLQSANSSRVTFQGAAPSPATLSFALGSAGLCAQLERAPFGGSTPPGTLFLKGTLTVKSARIDARWPVLVRAEPSEDDSLRELSVSLDTENPPGDGALSAPYGLSGVDVAGYDSSSLALSLVVSPGPLLRGTLSVIGYTRPVCSTTVTMEPGGGSSSPGCPGATPTEIEQATFAP